MNFKKIGKALLFPHLAIIILFLPISVTLLVCSLIFLESTSILSILSYVLAFYILVVLCFRIPKLIKIITKIKKENKFISKITTDIHLRVKISLYGSLMWNTTFAVFQLVLGFYHGSLWFYSMSAYYVILAIMRFLLFKHTKNYRAKEQDELELKKYLLCGWLLLVMNVALSIIIFFIVYWNKTFQYHMITTITLATYTFTTFTFAIINLIKYKKYNSPIYSASKVISLIASSVSMLTLETTMITTFGTNNSILFKQIMLGVSGFVITIFAITMAIIMIVKGNKKLKLFK